MSDDFDDFVEMQMSASSRQEAKDLTGDDSFYDESHRASRSGHNHGEFIKGCILWFGIIAAACIVYAIGKLY